MSSIVKRRCQSSSSSGLQCITSEDLYLVNYWTCCTGVAREKNQLHASGKSEKYLVLLSVLIDHKTSKDRGGVPYLGLI